MSDKGLLINAIDLVEIDGNANIPTVLYYQHGQAPAIGSDALALKKHRRELNEDFKIDLGNLKPGAAAPRHLFPTATGEKKSAAELTAAFIHEVLARVNEWMHQRELKLAPSIIVAEPLSMLTEADQQGSHLNEGWSRAKTWRTRNQRLAPKLPKQYQTCPPRQGIQRRPN